MRQRRAVPAGFARNREAVAGGSDVAAVDHFASKRGTLRRSAGAHAACAGRATSRREVALLSDRGDGRASAAPRVPWRRHVLGPVANRALTLRIVVARCAHRLGSMHHAFGRSRCAARRGVERRCAGVQGRSGVAGPGQGHQSLADWFEPSPKARQLARRQSRAAASRRLVRIEVVVARRDQV
jgi:hypothetical protein